MEHAGRDAMSRMVDCDEVGLLCLPNEVGLLCLPNELLDLIIRKVDRLTLLRLRIACRTLLTMAHRHAVKRGMLPLGTFGWFDFGREASVVDRRGLLNLFTLRRRICYVVGHPRSVRTRSVVSLLADDLRDEGVGVLRAEGRSEDVTSPPNGAVLVIDDASFCPTVSHLEATLVVGSTSVHPILMVAQRCGLTPTARRHIDAYIFHTHCPREPSLMAIVGDAGSAIRACIAMDHWALFRPSDGGTRSRVVPVWPRERWTGVDAVRIKNHR